MVRGRSDDLVCADIFQSLCANKFGTMAGPLGDDWFWARRHLGPGWRFTGVCWRHQFGSQSNGRAAPQGRCHPGGKRGFSHCPPPYL